MSTSNTHQQSLVDAGSKTRPLMLERGIYIPWASRFRRYLNRKRENRKWLNNTNDEGPYKFRIFTPSKTKAPRMQKEEDLRGNDLKHYEAEIEAMNLILISIPNDIYNSVDACTTAKSMWQRVKHLKQGTVQNNIDRETSFDNEFDQFVAEPREALVSVYKHFAQLMNDLERNGIIFPKVTININEKGHYARNCPKPRVRDSKYFIEQMLLAKQDEAGVILIDEQNNFLFADALRIEEIEELSANTCLMARIQPENFDSNKGPSYDSAFLNEVQTPSTIYVNPLFAKDAQEQKYLKQPKIINNTIGDDQIDSNIIFDEPNEDVNNGSVEYDNNVQESFALEQLARNTYKEDEKQQKFAQKADRKAKRFEQESQSQFIHDQDVIRDLEQQCDKLDLSVIEFKRQIMELQKTQSILKRRLSENKDKYHDTVIDLEARAKKNKDVMLKMDNSMQDEIEKIQRDSIEIQEGMQKQINIVENDVQRCQKQSIEFELQLQHEKERCKCESSLKIICDTSWISKMKKLESENVSLEFQVQSLIKERDNVKTEYQKLFDSIKRTRTQNQREISELIENVNHKTYAYTDVRAQNQDLWITISELKAKLKNAKKGLRSISRVRRPSNRDSSFKNSILSNTKNSSENVEVSDSDDSSAESMNIPSKEDLDHLFSPMYEEYFEKRSSDTSINSDAQQVHNHEDSPLTSSIVVKEYEAPPIVTTVEEQTSLIPLTVADETNQEDSTDFDGNTVFFPYDVLNFEEAESFTTSLDPSNMHEFHQRDVKTAFPNGLLKEEVYVSQPNGFVDPDFSNHVYRLKKALYGLKQAPGACQSQYAIELLKKHGIDECVSMRTPIATERLDVDLQGTLTDQTTYFRMIRGHMYLIASRPNIAFATFVCARYQACPTVKHLKEFKRIFWYLRQSYNMGLWYPKDFGLEIIAYSDTDHARWKHKDGVEMKILSWIITDEMKLAYHYRMTLSAPRSHNPEMNEGELSAPQKSTIIRLRIP
nr:hypothetical protein [Tanacetum cinerariifolium]